jgi:hypothetical protein
MTTPRIHPPGIPTVKNLGMYVQLKATAVQLRSAGQRYRNGGVEFHKRFQGLKPEPANNPVYKAPEGEDLRRSTQPVSDNAWWFGSQIVKLSSILWHFADRAHYWENELRNVQEDAWRFVHSVEGTGDEWTRSAEKVAQNNALIGRVEAALTGRLNDEVETRKQIYALIFVSPRPPDLGQGSNKAKEMPWGSRAKPPSVLDDFIWSTSFGLPQVAALPSWAKTPFAHYFRLGNPIRAALGDMITFIPNQIYHHAQDFAAGKGMSRLQKDLDALEGLAKLVVGIGTFTTPAGIAGFFMRKETPEYLPEGVRNWMDEADKAAIGFVGFDKFGSGDISGGLGTFIANVGGLIATRKLPPGLGLGRGVAMRGSIAGRALTASRFATSTSSMAWRFGRGLDLSSPHLGRSLDATIDGAPLRFIKEEARALSDIRAFGDRGLNGEGIRAVRQAEREDLNTQRAGTDQTTQHYREQAAEARTEKDAARDRYVDTKRADRDYKSDERRRSTVSTEAEHRAQRRRDARVAFGRQARDDATADARAEREAGLVADERKQDANLAAERATEDARTRIRQDADDRNRASVQKREDVEIAIRRKAFDSPLTAQIIGDLKGLLVNANSDVAKSRAADPFADGRPLDEVSDRLQRDLDISREDAEVLVKRFVQARESGVTRANIDALQGRVNGGGLADLLRELDELTRQRQ